MQEDWKLKVLVRLIIYNNKNPPERIWATKVRDDLRRINSDRISNSVLKDCLIDLEHDGIIRIDKDVQLGKTRCDEIRLINKKKAYDLAYTWFAEGEMNKLRNLSEYERMKGMIKKSGGET